MKIIKIEYVDNVRYKNLHNNMIFPMQNILRIYFDNNTMRVIDLFSEKDTTDIDYFEVLETNRTKVRVIMEDREYKDL